VDIVLTERLAVENVDRDELLGRVDGFDQRRVVVKSQIVPEPVHGDRHDQCSQYFVDLQTRKQHCIGVSDFTHCFMTFRIVRPEE